MTGKRWTEEEIEFLKNNYNNLTNREIGLKINKSVDAVQLKSRKIGLKKESKYTYETDYFKNIDSHDKAYWLGFIYADGYIIHNEKDRNYEFGITLSKKDHLHLKKLNKCLGGNVEVTFRTRLSKFPNGTSKVHEQCEFRIYSKTFVENLMANGIKKNKTYKNFNIPIDNESLKWSFVRGYLDGDGHISISSEEDKYGYNVGFTSLCQSLLEELSAFFEGNGIESRIHKNNKIKGNSKQCYQLSINKIDSYNKFLEKCYENPTVYLDRKFKLYNIAKNAVAL